MVSKNSLGLDRSEGLKRSMIVMFSALAMLFICSAFFAPTAMAFDFSSITVSESTGISMGSSIDATTNYDSITGQIKEVLQWTTGILALVMFFFLIWQFMKLGASGDNEMGRKKAIQGILTSGIALALFGGSNIVIGFFWNAFSSNTTSTGDGNGDGDGNGNSNG